MKIEVTEEDIRLGNNNAFTCPVARAVSRRMNRELGDIRVCGTWIYFEAEKKQVVTPKEASEFIFALPWGKSKPFIFELDMENLYVPR